MTHLRAFGKNPPHKPSISVTRATYEKIEARARRQGTPVTYVLNRLIIGELATKKEPVMQRNLDNDDWIQTLKGSAFHIFEPEPCDFDIEEIAHALAMQCRFNGHVKHFYSVAEHSCRVALLLREWGEPPDVVFAGLMHDAAEAYIGDVVRPLKRGLEAYQKIEAKIEASIAVQFGIAFPLPPIVKKADTVMLLVERRALLAKPPKPWNEPELAMPESPGIVCETDWRTARASFLAHFDLMDAARRWDWCDECKAKKCVCDVTASDNDA